MELELRKRVQRIVLRQTGRKGDKGDPGVVQEIIAGDNITIDNTNPAEPVISSTGGGGAVASVNGQTGVVTLDADDIDDSSTTHKFVDAAEKTKLSNLSGTNTGDQDLSGLATKATTVSAGTGLSGGGDLSTNRTIGLSSASQTSLGKADTALQAVEDDTSPTLGGTLDADGNSITGVEQLSVDDTDEAPFAIEVSADDEMGIGRSDTDKSFSSRKSMSFHTESDKSFMWFSSSWTKLMELLGGTGVLKVFGGIDVSDNRINNLQDPASDQDAATKIYVDHHLIGNGANLMHESTETMGVPTDGAFQIDQVGASIGGATLMHISKSTDDSFSMANWLAQLTEGSIIKLRYELLNNYDYWFIKVTSITEESTYYVIGIEVLNGAPVFTEEESMWLDFDIVGAGGGGGGGIESVVAGDNISVDDTDPANPIVSATSGSDGVTVGLDYTIVLAVGPGEPAGPGAGEFGTWDTGWTGDLEEIDTLYFNKTDGNANDLSEFFSLIDAIEGSPKATLYLQQLDDVEKYTLFNVTNLNSDVDYFVAEIQYLGGETSVAADTAFRVVFDRVGNPGQQGDVGGSGSTPGAHYYHEAPEEGDTLLETAPSAGRFKINQIDSDIMTATQMTIHKTCDDGFSVENWIDEVWTPGAMLFLAYELNITTDYWFIQVDSISDEGDYYLLDIVMVSGSVNFSTEQSMRLFATVAGGGGSSESKIIGINLNDTTHLTTGDGKYYFDIPATIGGMNLTAARASCVGAPTGADILIQVHNVTQAVDMLSTRLEIEDGETDSSTGTAVVIDTSNDDVATADKLRIDVDTTGTGATWVFVELTFEAP